MSKIVKIVKNCQKISRLLKIVKIVKNCQRLSKIVKKIVKTLKNCQNSQKLSNVVKIVKIVENCQNCQNCPKNVKKFNMLVRSCFLITLIKCLKGHKSQRSLCNVKSKSTVSEWQVHLLSCSGQLNISQLFTIYIFKIYPKYSKFIKSIVTWFKILNVYWKLRMYQSSEIVENYLNI